MPGERILLVDDNPSNLKVLELALGGEGYQIDKASSGARALELVAELAPALILMDLQMPGMDGLEVTRIIKSDPKNAAIVVLAVTSYAMKGDRERALGAGCDGYLSKPIDTRAMPKLVAAALAARRHHGDSSHG